MDQLKANSDEIYGDLKLHCEVFLYTIKSYNYIQHFSPELIVWIF